MTDKIHITIIRRFIDLLLDELSGIVDEVVEIQHEFLRRA
jgi:hypothetical protein